MCSVLKAEVRPESPPFHEKPAPFATTDAGRTRLEPFSQSVDTRAIMHPNEALFANESFYLAFAAGDSDAMEQLWSRQHPLVCIHPGWPALVGRESVIDSWRQILANPDQPEVEFYGARAVELGSGIAVVCYEVLPGTVLVAMNLFIAENGEARLVHHQSGPCGDPPPRDAVVRRLDA